MPVLLLEKIDIFLLQFAWQITLCAGYVRHVTHDEIADAVG